MIIRLTCSQKPEYISVFKTLPRLYIQVQFPFVNYPYKYIKKLSERIWEDTNEMLLLQY